MSSAIKQEKNKKKYLFSIFVFRKYDGMGNFDESTRVNVVHTDRVEAEKEALEIVNDPDRQMVHTKEISEVREENGI